MGFDNCGGGSLCEFIKSKEIEERVAFLEEYVDAIVNSAVLYGDIAMVGEGCYGEVQLNQAFDCWGAGQDLRDRYWVDCQLLYSP